MSNSSRALSQLLFSNKEDSSKFIFRNLLSSRHFINSQVNLIKIFLLLLLILEKDKLLEVVIYNASNNSILKNKLEKILN